VPLARTRQQRARLNSRQGLPAWALLAADRIPRFLTSQKSARLDARRENQTWAFFPINQLAV
jgi:hypothetical protein